MDADNLELELEKKQNLADELESAPLSGRGRILRILVQTCAKFYYGDTCCILDNLQLELQLFCLQFIFSTPPVSEYWGYIRFLARLRFWPVLLAQSMADGKSKLLPVIANVLNDDLSQLPAAFREQLIGSVSILSGVWDSDFHGNLFKSQHFPLEWADGKRTAIGLACSAMNIPALFSCVCAGVNVDTPCRLIFYRGPETFTREYFNYIECAVDMFDLKGSELCPMAINRALCWIAFNSTLEGGKLKHKWMQVIFPQLVLIRKLAVLKVREKLNEAVPYKMHGDLQQCILSYLGRVFDPFIYTPSLVGTSAETVFEAMSNLRSLRECECKKKFCGILPCIMKSFFDM